MSQATIVLIAGAAGGIAWASITLAATSWFNRRVRRAAAQEQRDRTFQRRLRSAVHG